MTDKSATTERQTTVADQLIEWLHRHGIRHVFGTPSGGWLPYMEAMRTGGVEFVLVSNEASAGFMATVYARIKGVPGACYATVGPGATNLSTGVGAALLNRDPILAFTSEAPRDMMGRTVQMEIDQQALFEPLTKKTTRLEPSRVSEVMDDAYRVATSGIPGPVHIGLPGDLAGLEISGDMMGASRTAADTVPVSAAGSSALEKMKGLFRTARRPVLAAGLGAVRSGSAPLIRKLVERHNVPVVLTPMAKGMLSEDHLWYSGVLFHALSDIVAETHQQADLVVGIGYDPVEFNYEEWMPHVPLIHIDGKPADIDKNEYPDVVDVIGSIPESLEVLVAEEPLVSGWDPSALEERRNRMQGRFTPKPGVFGPVAALHLLREKLPEDGMMACDVGSHTHLIGQMWRTPEPGLQIMDNGWSSMGFGVPAAIAAKIAAPEREVACVVGDGGFLMMAGEMATAKRLGARVVFVMLCDNSLDLIRLKQDRRGSRSYGTALGPDLSTGDGDMFGVPVLKAADDGSYREALDKAFAGEGPVIIKAFIDPSEYDDLILRKHK